MERTREAHLDSIVVSLMASSVLFPDQGFGSYGSSMAARRTLDSCHVNICTSPPSSSSTSTPSSTGASVESQTLCLFCVCLPLVERRQQTGFPVWVHVPLSFSLSVLLFSTDQQPSPVRDWFHFPVHRVQLWLNVCEVPETHTPGICMGVSS